uniref:Oxysterol-binding protein-related protein 9 (Trinotate prediction) n=1 Tax=Henneguya salminicola TaxID=69463 RepID=A0A6G3MG23_HENSL
MEGYLEKWSKKTESFEKRYVVICPNNKTLFYFINDDMKDINNPRGRISLEKVLLSLEDSETPTFTIILDDKKVLLFKAPDINSRNAWISKISEISLIFHHNNDKNTFSQSQLCLDALKDSSDELRDALESSTQMDGACVYDLKVLVLDNLRNFQNYSTLFTMILIQLKYFDKIYLSLQPIMI